jgi:polar amino acid transport system substrate-binding protein
LAIDIRRLTLVLTLAGSVAMAAQSDEARRQLLPTGKLRVGLNTNNLLTRAVGADIGRDLARRLGVDAVLVEYPSPGAVTDAVGAEWDIAFVAADPDREGAISFTPPYVELDATYLVRGDSPIHAVNDVDRPGVRIATGATSAYTLVLKRDLRHATLVFLTNDEAVEQLRGGTVDAVAGLRDTLVRSAPRVAGARVLAGNITRAQQSVAVPKGNDAALAYLTQYLSEIKKTGFISRSIERTGAIGASIAP